jgi:hypothetical protein
VEAVVLADLLALFDDDPAGEALPPARPDLVMWKDLLPKEAPMTEPATEPAATAITVETDRGVRTFKADTAREDDAGTLHVLNGNREVASFKGGKWDGYFFHDALDDDPRPVTESAA